jgi:hypothetical protein
MGWHLTLLDRLPSKSIELSEQSAESLSMSFEKYFWSFPE